ncbi:16S rRNA (guanine(527)-N(7))-methyltransferase RsmG [Leptolyngbya sp. PCC 6406]|uniref:16S rRNA (guanine(527)-N(7))-methyltransferase RsmG n=1 Tax=Leptolyngbya sp. PCC 6406 TaxID=1173264 RepID=UPI00047F9F83|nr:16S rRNA (guanine(527)-N(7))-methyltransferase RsmG [Leptolyngbya sp. PCC 6406]
MAITGLARRDEIWQSTLGWQPGDAQWAQFQALYQGILAGNEQINLTRLTEPDDFWEKHLWDSLSGLWPWLGKGDGSDQRPDWAQSVTIAQVIDIGTGAGFPGLPAAIAYPDWTITLLDATQKKIRFLEELALEMGLTQVRAIADRAESLGHRPHHRGKYDLALLRAVGPVSPCVEYGLPLVRVGGMAVLYRGQWTPEEEATVERVAAQLGGELTAVQSWQTPLTEGMRHCVYLRKVRPSPGKFPRQPGLPAKKPL